MLVEEVDGAIEGLGEGTGEVVVGVGVLVELDGFVGCI